MANLTFSVNDTTTTSESPTLSFNRFDNHANFAYSTVATAPSPATTGVSLTVQSGDGAKFPLPPFNATIWQSGANPLTTNAEIVRVTAISGDTLTITRTTSTEAVNQNRSIIVGDQIANTITTKILTDLEVPASQAVTATVATSQTTTSSTFGDLATPGPSVGVTIGQHGMALVSVSCDFFNSTTDYSTAGVLISFGGSTEIAATQYLVNQGTNEVQFGNTVLLTGLIPGYTTFKMQYKNANNASTATFKNRTIAVVPL